MDTSDAAWELYDEDEEDLEHTSPELREEIRNTVTFTLDWSVGSLLKQLQDGQIDLQPAYQRRDAWSISRKSRFIESLVLGLPVPQLVLAEERQSKGSFLVLDGKQRLTSLLQFIGAAQGSASNAFKLHELPMLVPLNGVSYAEMQSNAQWSQHLHAFVNQAVRTVVLRGWQSDELLHLVFHRLNSSVVPLSAQELRQALIRGPFLQYLNDYSAHSAVLQSVLKLKEPDFRMRDSEVLLRLLAFSLFRSSYRGDLKRFLDDSAKRINQRWGSQAAVVEDRLKRIERALDLWTSALGTPERVGRKHTSKGYEPRLNRAVLDAQVGATEDPAVEDVLANKPALAAPAFEQLMISDPEFARSVESTTKTLDAASYRVDAVRRAIAAAGAVA